MPRGGVDPIVRYAVLGGLGFIAYKYAQAQPASSWPKQTADQVAGWLRKPPLPAGGTRASIPPPNPPPPGEPVEGGEAWTHLAITDLGGFPLEMRPNRLRQRADLGGTNEYQPGDVMIDTVSGRQWQWLGGLAIQATDGTGETTRLDYYSLAIGSP